MDFVARWFDRGQAPGAERALLGVNYPDDPALYHQVSPVTHFRPGLPPALLIYGGQDDVVHPRQGQLAAQVWRATGACAELHVLDGIGHVEDGADRTGLLQILRLTCKFVRDLHR